MSRATPPPANVHQRRIPPINHLAELVQQALANLKPPHHVAVRLARLVATAMRADHNLTEAQAVANLTKIIETPGPKAVINATGILLHTNLGRAPLDPSVIEAAINDVSGYTDLEFDLSSGNRGHRDRHFAELARMVWNVEDATLVNNAAAAITLAVGALAGHGETVVSRGELIEIGGSFRLPDILALAGTKLVEVGTTNKTRLNDYQRAINPDTACLLKTHPSNYRIEGFTQSTALADLCELGRHHQLPVIMDLGGGLSTHLPFPKIEEPLIEDYLEADPDLLIFSGDKLFGAVQGGIVLGKSAAISKLRKHPMMRMLRADKLTISILCHQLQRTFLNLAHPFSKLAEPDLQGRRHRAESLVAELPQSLGAKVVESEVFMGGGSLPQEKRLSIAITLAPPKPAKLAKALRLHSPAIVGYVRDERLWLDMGTVFPDQDVQILNALKILGAR